MGRFGGEQGEEVVARRTADDAVEVHCHGGWAAVAMIEETLMAAGCRRVALARLERPARPRRLPIRRPPPLAALLADARTERCAAILLDQHQGALGRAMDEIRQAIGRGDRSTAGRQIERCWPGRSSAGT